MSHHKLHSQYESLEPVRGTINAHLPPTEDLLHHRSDLHKSDHVEEKVDDAGVQEHRCSIGRKIRDEEQSNTKVSMNTTRTEYGNKSTSGTDESEIYVKKSGIYMFMYVYVFGFSQKNTRETTCLRVL